MITVKTAHYRDVIKNLTLEDFYDDLSETLSEGQLRMAWFMQDGAPPHTVHDTVVYLKELSILTRLLAN